MRTWKRMRRLAAATEAQALTEFVIVIPIVLLMFFAALQTLVVARCVAMSDYAAFAAARSFATMFAKFERDGMNASAAYAQAEARAQLVACMALAPVSTGINPYLSGFDEVPDSWIDSLRMSPAGPLVGTSVPAHLRQQITEGFIVALTMRVHDFEITPSLAALATDSSTEEIRASFEYMVPVTIPGLMEIWRFLFYYSADPAQWEDITDPTLFSMPGAANTAGISAGDVDRILKEWQPHAQSTANAAQFLNYFTGGGGQAAPTIAIRAHSTVGFEPRIGGLPP